MMKNGNQNQVRPDIQIQTEGIAGRLKTEALPKLAGEPSANTRSTFQRWFLLAMVGMYVLFFALLFLGNVGNQTDFFYLGGRDFMNDALNTEGYSRTLDPYEWTAGEDRVPFKDANYPPLAYVLFWLMDAVSGRNETTPWAMAVAVGLGAAGVLLLGWTEFRLTEGSKSKRVLLAVTLALSMPSVYAFERGNIILLAVVLCNCFLIWNDSEHPVLRELSFLALAVAAALKIYPALLGLLLLKDRRWKEALRLMAYGAIMVFLPFVFIKGGFQNLPLLFENFGAHTAFYNRRIYPRFGFRLFASMTYDTTFANPWLNDQLWKLGAKMFSVFPGIDLILSVLCLAGAYWNKRRWESVAAILLVVINYPVNSGTYTALYLLPAIALFLSDEALTRRDLWYLIGFLVMVNPVQMEIPYALLGITDPILCNLTAVFRNLAAYAMFVALAIKGGMLTVRAGKTVLRKQKLPRQNDPAMK